MPTSVDQEAGRARRDAAVPRGRLLANEQERHLIIMDATLARADVGSYVDMLEEEFVQSVIDTMLTKLAFYAGKKELKSLANDEFKL